MKKSLIVAGIFVASIAGPLAMTSPATAATPTSSTVTTAPAAVIPAPRVVAVPASRPTKWRGARLVHPSGRAFSPQVTRWANLTLYVMRELSIKDKFLAGVLAQIQQESGGDPDAVNLWDSNAKRGTPSKGLLQVIAPTYKAYAKPGYKKLKYQTVPYTNIWAALNYVKKAYGMKKFRAWAAGQNQGY